ncbi:MAG: PA14 domain-containing protein [Akkermansiaceae bacterium]|nr:PA14 domain-containing protein [Akkermansiaceae bacterium]
MLFRNPLLLAGLVGVLIPVILHLIRRQAAKPYDWGAMRFLFDTVAARRRRMEWEDFLLMIARCLLIALIALAVARPFVPPNSGIPWLFVLPFGLLGIAAFGGSFVLSSLRWRWVMRGLAILMLLGAGVLIWQEKNLNLERFETSERRDVAIVIDGSTSMLLRENGRTAFERAVEEARDLVKGAPKGTAFSIILGGPAPELKTGTPLSHRADVLEVLEKLEPVGGPFRAHDALGVATLSLAEGRGSSKDLVVFTDLQRIGWQFDSATSWGNLGDAWEGLPEGAEPRLLLRSFPPPEKLRNVSVTGIELSRNVVGTDREVAIRISIENTGTEVVTPGLMRIIVGEKELEPKGLGQMAPGESSILDYRYQFSKTGPQVIKVDLDGNDDLSGDDVAEKAVWVKKTLPVLIVEGNAGASFFQRAGGYLSLALAPVTGKEETFVDPRVIDAAALTREDIDNDAVIVLADVTRLPASAATRIADFVINGGGLWVVAGPKVDPVYYDSWSGGDGKLMPLKLGEMRLPEKGVQAAPGTFDHPVLRLFKDEVGQDLGEAVIEGYRASSDLVEGALAAARYSDGEIFLATRNYGNGRVIVTTTALDARMGSLPARPSFVPFVHEMTNWLAGGQTVNLNVRASWNPSLSLPGGGGLKAEYRSLENRGESLSRIDPAIDFNWESRAPQKGLPADRFGVTWTGALIPPASGEYVFEVNVDDKFLLKLDGETVYEGEEEQGRSEKVELLAGKPVMFSASYEEEWGSAWVTLSWMRPDGVKEVIPASVFIPVSQDESNVVLGDSSAKDPMGRERNVAASLGRRGKLLEVDGSAIPGEYLVGIPNAVQDLLLGEKEVPLVVEREGDESRLESWNEDDRRLVRREVKALIELKSIKDVLAALRGEGFGQEIWKILAIAALILFFLEGVLARWVSKSRKAGEEVKVDFENRDEIPDSFLKSAAETKGAKGGMA